MRNALFLSALLLPAAACGYEEPPDFDFPAEGSGNDGDDDWQEVEAGLEFRDTTTGDGAAIASGSNISADYTLWLWADGEKGTELEASQQPFQTPIGVGRVIPCWDKGLLGMTEGSVRELLCEPQHAYGSAGQGSVPPNATLFFEVELYTVGTGE